MTEELPAPKSRKEEYLATAAGMTGIELPEPASREEIYLDAIAQGGGGGGGGTSDFDQLSNRPKYNGSTMTSSTNIPEVPPKMVVLSYGTSTWQDFIKAYNDNAVVYCRASSSADPASGSQTRMAFMAYVSSPSNPTSVEFQYVRSVNNKSASQQCDQVFVYKLASTGTWSVETRDVASKIVAGTGLTSSYSDGTLTLESSGGSGPSVVQTIGTSTTDVMSQDAVTKTVFGDTYGEKVKIGSNATTTGGSSVAVGRAAKANSNFTVSIGYNNKASGQGTIAIGNSTLTYSQGSVALGCYTRADGHGAVAIGGYSDDSDRADAHANGAVAIGLGSQANTAGEFNIGDRSSTYGYNNSAYRLVSGVYDGQNAHDAVTVGQVNSVIDAINTALSTSIPHIGASS